MIDELAELLRRQASALQRMEGRLRAIELLIAAEEQRFVALALDELEAAGEQLAGLELARVLALSTAGLPADVDADTLIAADATGDGALPRAVEDLRGAMRRASDARERAVAVVSRHGGETRTRLAAASAFSAVG